MAVPFRGSLAAPQQPSRIPLGSSLPLAAAPQCEQGARGHANDLRRTTTETPRHRPLCRTLVRTGHSFYASIEDALMHINSAATRVIHQFRIFEHGDFR